MNGTPAAEAVLKVAIPGTRQEAFDYWIAKPNSNDIGKRVSVPFRSQYKTGLIINVGKACAPIEKIKPVKALLDDQPLMPRSLLKLCAWVADYYQAPISEVIASALPKKLRQGKPAAFPEIEYYHLKIEFNQARERLSPRAKKQRQLLELLAQAPQSKNQLSHQGFRSQQLNPLLESGLIAHEIRQHLPTQPSFTPQPPANLTPEQHQAVEQIEQKAGFHCHLIYGVTGSGKTEVYFNLIETQLNQGRQALILVPEIGLTPQLIHRFSRRFAQPIAVIHSHLNDSERLNAWLMAASGRARVLLGTRSALFTPLPELGIILIDEEHDASYKQQSGVRYSARDTAIVRAQLSNIPIILGSATPSLESLHNVQTGKYHCHRLTHRAISTAPNKVHLIDCRAQTLNHGLSNRVLHAIENHLNQKHQVLVFINRRGYAPILLCHACGAMNDCHQCSNHLTVHHTKQRLQCHHCGLNYPIPKACPQCQSQELIPIGIGTQRVSDYLTQRFPQVKSLRIDRDSTTQKQALQDKLEQINSGKAQLLIGTQMLAKGHHFPRLNLVVILEADTGLLSQDFKAIERTGQLLIQVAGRAGRATGNKSIGEVLIQTHQPDNPLLNDLVQKGYQCFATHLLEQRRVSLLPPYSYLCLIRAKSKSFTRVLNFLTLTKGMLNSSQLQVLGPAPAPLEKKANYHCMQLLIKSSNRNGLNQALHRLRTQLHRHKILNGILWSVDIDPQDLS